MSASGERTLPDTAHPPFDSTTFIEPAVNYMTTQLKDPQNWELVQTRTPAGAGIEDSQVIWHGNVELLYTAVDGFNPNVFYTHFHTRKHLDLMALMVSSVPVTPNHHRFVYKRFVSFEPDNVPGLLTRAQVLRGEKPEGSIDWAVTKVMIEPSCNLRDNLIVGENPNSFRTWFHLSSADDILWDEQQKQELEYQQFLAKANHAATRLGELASFRKLYTPPNQPQ